jgi:hypothetical protein
MNIMDDFRKENASRGLRLLIVDADKASVKILKGTLKVYSPWLYSMIKTKIHEK